MQFRLFSASSEHLSSPLLRARTEFHRTTLRLSGLDDRVGSPSLTLDRVTRPNFGPCAALKRLLLGLPTLTVVASDALMGRERSDAAGRPGIN